MDETWGVWSLTGNPPSRLVRSGRPARGTSLVRANSYKLRKQLKNTWEERAYGNQLGASLDGKPEKKLGERFEANEEQYAPKFDIRGFPDPDRPPSSFGNLEMSQGQTRPSGMNPAITSQRPAGTCVVFPILHRTLDETTMISFQETSALNLA
ncbi:hypothetical protein GQ53DRAFT_754989 [Thozetella sp. PMI_491]|nr:hypothetical protein GQ53DRAFT_754989 [Thozetella sp. PMI_491]